MSPESSAASVADGAEASRARDGGQEGREMSQELLKRASRDSLPSFRPPTRKPRFFAPRSYLISVPFCALLVILRPGCLSLGRVLRMDALRPLLLVPGIRHFCTPRRRGLPVAQRTLSSARRALVNQRHYIVIDSCR